MSWVPSVVIIGAGFGGICAAIQLQKQLGFTNFIIYEKNENVGGTWLQNTYPGCACDVPSHLYSFSFAPNPNWSKKYSPAAEILHYLKDVVQEFGIHKYIQFNTAVIKAEWSEEERVWQIVTKHNNVEKTSTANIVILGTGIFSQPNIPDTLVSKFTGQWAHSAKWNKDVVLANKTVAVIGSGASALQIIPTIAKQVKQLYVYQRTPAWVRKKNDYFYSQYWKSLLSWVPFVGKLYRWALFYEHDIKQLVFRRGSTISSMLYKVARLEFDSQMKTRIPCEPVRKSLTPNYELGCKRIILSDDYFEAFSLPNVELITDSISEVSGNTIYSGNGTQTKVDAIVLATGFNIETFFSPMKLYGNGGLELLDAWDQERPEAYFGLSCYNFPNLFFLLGPNSGLGHNSIIFIIECQVNAVMNVIKEMMEKNVAVVNLKKEVQRDFNIQLQKDLKATVWASGCKSWYYSEKKGNYTLWPFSCVEFWRQTRKIDIGDFDVIQNN